jgi:dihydroneopterin aldolase
MEFFAYHGHFEEETKVGNYFIVNLEIKSDTKKAEASDCLEDALNYVDIYRLVAKEMDQPSKLVENVAKRILDSLFFNFPLQILRAKVEVQKMNPPLGSKMESVSVTLEQ